MVAFRALVTRPLQTGLTRHRFCAWAQACQSTFEQCLPERGTDRPGCILTLAIAFAWQSVIAIRAFPPFKSFPSAVAGSARLFFPGKRQFYSINGFDAFAPLAERVFLVEGGMHGSGLDPFVEELGPHSEVVGLKFPKGCAFAQSGRNMGFAVFHEAHTHAQEAPGHAEVGMLLVGAAPPVVLLEVGGAVLAEMVAALDDVVLEDVVASARHLSGLRTFFGAAGLLGARDDPGVGTEPANARLGAGRADCAAGHARRECRPGAA